MQALEKRIGHTFKNRQLLEEALTHPSLGNRQSNQRLEFLGDAVLGLVVLRILYEMYPNEPEGDLARRHAALVCGPTLAEVGSEIHIGDSLFMASSEETAGGRSNPSNVEDACEALIGALYLDGGLKAAEAFIVPRWKPLAKKVKAPPKDAKTTLQEWAQERALPVPSYAVVENTGPAHAPQFAVEVSVRGQAPLRGTAGTKR